MRNYINSKAVGNNRSKTNHYIFESSIPRMDKANVECFINMDHR